MKRYIKGNSRDQGTLFPDRLEDWIDDENAVRVIDVFVDHLDLRDLGGMRLAETFIHDLGESGGISGHLLGASDVCNGVGRLTRRL